MKRCPFCGMEYPDEVEVCSTDGKLLLRIDEALPTKPAAGATEPRPTISEREQRFWEQMTFKEFAALFLRLQSLWLFFYAAIEFTYLVRFLYLEISLTTFSHLPSADRRSMFFITLRLVMYIAAGLLAIKYAEKLVSWLVRDWVANQPRENEPN